MTGSDAAARPVDVKGMCTTGAGDPFDPYWRQLCTLIGVDYEKVPMTTTTVDRQTIRASYNGGFVAARRACGLFERTEHVFRRLTTAGMTPWPSGPTMHTGAGVLSGAATAYWGTSQAAFSLAAVAGGHAVRLLPETHNFPLHLAAEMPDTQFRPRWSTSTTTGCFPPARKTQTRSSPEKWRFLRKSPSGSRGCCRSIRQTPPRGLRASANRACVRAGKRNRTRRPRRTEADRRRRQRGRRSSSWECTAAARRRSPAPPAPWVRPRQKRCCRRAPPIRADISKASRSLSRTPTCSPPPAPPGMTGGRSARTGCCRRHRGGIVQD